MIWFIVNTIFYFFAIAMLVFFIVKGYREKISDKQEVDEAPLLKGAKFARQLSLRGFDIRNSKAMTDALLEEGAPKRAGVKVFFLGIILMVATVGFPILLTYLVSNAFVPSGYTSISTDTFVLRYIFAGAFGMSVLITVPFASDAVRKWIEKRFGSDTAKEFGASKTVLASKMVMLFFFAALYPLLTLGMNCYAGYNETGIVYNSFFSISETTTQYTEVIDVDRYFHRSDNGEISSMHYEITLKNSEEIDILFSDDVAMINQTYEIHGYLLAARPELFTDVVDEPLEDIDKYLRDYDRTSTGKVYRIFGL
jgi:hypothetical protein